MARALTRTATLTRTDLLVLQVRAAMDRAMDTDPSSFERIVAQGIRRRSIGEVVLRAVDGEGLTHASLTLRIDWATNRLLISREGEGLAVRASWEGGVSPDVLRFAEHFGEYAEEQGLSVKDRYVYSPGVDAAEERRVLGFVEVEPVRWADGEIVGADIRLQHLTEMTTSLRYVEVRSE